MTSLDRIPPLALKREIEVEFSISSNPTFFAETCGFVLRVPTVHETFETFEDKFLEATENYLGYGSIRFSIVLLNFGLVLPSSHNSLDYMMLVVNVVFFSIKCNHD